MDRLGLPPSPPSSPPDRHHRLDALTWLLVPALALAVLPNGFVSADGLGQSLAFSTGRWHLNPNHLLFDPLAAGWIALWKLAGCRWHPADVLEVLSGISGALALALFRLLVAPRLAATRWLANQATAYVAFSSAFLRLWVSDEVQMVQMPLVVLVAAVGDTPPRRGPPRPFAGARRRRRPRRPLLRVERVVGREPGGGDLVAAPGSA